ncbi:MAG TPA: oxidoreductase-like domain-containing protein [Burkholderiaceae bacterium]|nr:oxidoreductase-like domain-containing protein [Burkholderiaceae bacterium]
MDRADPSSCLHDDPPPGEPEPPAEGACCGSGCDPCVWDLYAEERARWMDAMRAWQARQEAHDRETSTCTRADSPAS